MEALPLHSMAGLDPAIQCPTGNPAFELWMAASEGGHDVVCYAACFALPGKIGELLDQRSHTFQAAPPANPNRRDRRAADRAGSSDRRANSEPTRPTPRGLRTVTCTRVTTPPFGPASTFAIPAARQRPLISITSSKCSTSGGNDPKRSTSSAAKASISSRFSRPDKRR